MQLNLSKLYKALLIPILFYYIQLHWCSEQYGELNLVLEEMRTYFLWLSVSVMPCDDTLKCTTVAVGGEAAVSVSEMALAMAWGPVKDSISTELM